MNVESHRKAIRESLDMIKEAIDRGVENRQRTIGFHCSVAAADILELYLHSQHLIDPGMTIKHDFFSSLRMAHERIKADFPRKEEIFRLIHELETERNLLCYGKPRDAQEIERYIEKFNRLRKIFDEIGVKYE